MILPWRYELIVGSQVVRRSAEVVRPSCRSKAQDVRETCAFCFSFCRLTAEERSRPQTRHKGREHRKIIALRRSRDPPERPKIHEKSMKNRSGALLGCSGASPGRPGTPQGRSVVSPGRSRAAPGPPRAHPWAPQSALRRSWDVPRSPRNGPKTPPERFGDSSGRSNKQFALPNGSQHTPGSIFY